MSGHSKWATIKHQKASNDAKRGKIFSKLGKDIAVAVREGGSPDVDANPRLRLIFEKARAANMPKDNIERAIDRGAGRGEGGQLETITFEGFGPENMAVIAECVTDNKNRTTQEVRSFFDKHGGRIASAGSVSYLFDQKGRILVSKQGSEEEQMLKLIDCGAQDMESSGSQMVVYTLPDQLHKVVEDIRQAGFKVEDAELIYKAKAERPISDPTIKGKLQDFLEELDELDDIQRIFTDIKLG